MKQYKKIKIGDMYIGGDAPIAVQSMCNIPFRRFDELKQQALKLQGAGCDILRVSVPDEESVIGFAELKKVLDIPLVADIHFNYKFALGAIDAGADKIRINPGNMGKDKIRLVVDSAKAHNIPIRVGINSGSLEKELLVKYGSPTAEALAESAMNNVRMLEECDFDNIVVSMKSSSVRLTVDAYRAFDRINVHNYPLHVGVTEAGTMHSGLIKGSAGIGALLLDGIGSTVRYSLTADPVEEIYAAKTLLQALGFNKSGIEVISCPTCGRTTVNSVELANRIEKEFAYVKQHIKIAVMGCIVNGIGEAREADFGVTGANGEYVLFKKDPSGDVKILQHHISPDDVFNVIAKQIEFTIKTDLIEQKVRNEKQS